MALMGTCRSWYSLTLMPMMGLAMRQFWSLRSFRPWQPLLLITTMMWLAGSLVSMAETTYPTTIHTRYEAIDPKLGGQFIVWLDREKIWHGVDPRLPAVKYVDVTHLTPAQGSGPITIIEIMPINSVKPEFYHFTGIVHFKVTGMTLKVSNTPAEPTK
jgi:hypothetical protein